MPSLADSADRARVCPGTGTDGLATTPWLPGRLPRPGRYLPQRAVAVFN